MATPPPSGTKGAPDGDRDLGRVPERHGAQANSRRSAPQQTRGSAVGGARTLDSRLRRGALGMIGGRTGHPRWTRATDLEGPPVADLAPAPAGAMPPPALSVDEAQALAGRHELRALGERPPLGQYLRDLWQRRSFLWTAHC